MPAHAPGFRGRVIGVALSLLLVVPVLHGQSATDSIRTLDSAWARAYATHDTSMAQALFARDLVVTSASGALKDREGEMADIRPLPGLQMHFFRTRDVVVHLHPAAAVVTGLAEWEFSYNGRVSSLRRRYTAVYVRGGPLGWQLAALHLGPAPESPPTR